MFLSAAAQGLVFVVDASDGFRLEEARKELEGKMLHIKTKTKTNTNTKTKTKTKARTKNHHFIKNRYSQ